MIRTILIISLFVFGCSSAEDEEINNDNYGDSSEELPPQPTNIEFTIHELWNPKLVWDQNNTVRRIQKWCGDSEVYITTPWNGGTSDGWTGFETTVYNHYSLDTLVIELHPNTTFFDFNISGRTDRRRNPKRIGHIEFIRVDENSKIKMDVDMILDQTDGGSNIFPIKYYSSNLEEDLITSLTIDGDSNGNQNCSNVKAFEQVDGTESYRKSTEISLVVSYDTDNLALKIGDSIGRSGYSSKKLGQGWNAMLNNNYIIVNKKILYD